MGKDLCCPECQGTMKFLGHENITYMTWLCSSCRTEWLIQWKRKLTTEEIGNYSF